MARTDRQKQRPPRLAILQGGSLRMEWTFAMAQRANLTGNNWKNYPAPCCAPA